MLVGLDYFNARYYSPAQGRFVSPDPGNAGADLSNPQTWNGYAYVGNNPLNLTDPNGLGFFSDLWSVFETAVGLYNTDGVQLTNTEPWNEMPPISGASGGTADVGSVYGGGAAGPFIFGWDQQSQLLRARTTWERLDAYDSTLRFLYDFLSGLGKTNRRYDLSSLETRDLIASKGFQQVNAFIQRACSAGQTSGNLNLGTFQAGKNLFYDAAHSPVGVQVGGYNGQWSLNGNRADITITNYAGLNSFAYHIAPNSPLSWGPLRTIKQTFSIKEPNPCGTR